MVARNVWRRGIHVAERYSQHVRCHCQDPGGLLSAGLKCKGKENLSLWYTVKVTAARTGRGRATKRRDMDLMHPSTTLRVEGDHASTFIYLPICL